jgi:hypothetical protein
VVVRRPGLGVRVAVRQDAKAQVRVFVDKLALGRGFVDQAVDEGAVAQGIAQQGGDLLPAGGAVVLLQDGAHLGGE